MEEIDEKIRKYYHDYYKTQLGLRDYESRISNRLREQDLFAKPNVDRLEYLLNYSFKDKKVLVVGGGTGAEFAELTRRGASCFAIEPDERAGEILMMRAEQIGVSSDKVSRSVSENIEYDDSSFDFVYCFAVIEHVSNVDKSIGEMIRVVKKDGYVYINTSDYRQYYEAHYKFHLPLFLPKWLLKVILFLKGRPVSYIDTLQFVNSRQLRNIFKRSNVIASQYFFPYEYPEQKQRGWKKMIRKREKKEIEQNQYWILRKI